MPRNGYTPILQPGLLEPCAVKVARTVLRGAGTGDSLHLPDNSGRRPFAIGLGAARLGFELGDAINDPAYAFLCESVNIRPSGWAQQPSRLLEEKSRPCKQSSKLGQPSQTGDNAMKIASYVLLGLLSCVEVLAEETAFDKALEAYRTYQKARHAYFEAVDTHEEVRLAQIAYRDADRANDEAYKKAKATFEKARDENKEVKGAYAIYQITADGYWEALHEIEEVRLAFTAWDEARKKVKAIQHAEKWDYNAWEKADAAWEKADDIYFTVLDVFREAIKKAYERGEKDH